MSPWIDRILKEFPADLARLWIAGDPDDVLLDAVLDVTNRCIRIIKNPMCRCLAAKAWL